jgi:hypothetical protein
MKYLLQRFDELATLLRGTLNREKTRIMMATNGKSTVESMIFYENEETSSIGNDPLQAISIYLTEKNNNDGFNPVEVTNGLRVPGAPIGSKSFFEDFINKAMAKAKSDVEKIVSGLEDLQTIMKIYSTCTVHKMTHHFPSDVIMADHATLPDCYYFWESPITQAFTKMTNSLIYRLTETTELPAHAEIISSLTTNQGGLGLQHPRANAIPAFMTTMKRCLKYSAQEVWLGYNKPRVTFSHPKSPSFTKNCTPPTYWQ